MAIQILVMVSGDGTSHTFPYEGYGTPQASPRLSLTDRDFPAFLVKVFSERGYSFFVTAEHVTIRDDKEKLRCKALDF